MTILRVMTFNIRGAPPEDGVNIWENRFDLTLQVIKDNQPDLIGFQEAQTENLEVLQNSLPEYAFASGLKANRPDRILFNAIFWKPEVLACITSDSFYLSRTPDVWSKDWDSARVRLAHWVKFRRLDNGVEFVHLNTHLDHISHQARIEGSKLILQQLAQLSPQPLPVLLTHLTQPVERD
jgi:endonuclease/exonuclease/phosphatase family metal-dependent hydrolase